MTPSHPHQGKTEEVKWQPYVTADDYGMVDFNDPFTPLKEVTAYAYTEFEADSDTSAELRLARCLPPRTGRFAASFRFP